MSKNLYSVLGVNRGADTEEIRKAYKALAREHHPDKGGDPEKFKELSQAHEILSDDGKRRNYDITGSITDQPQQNPFGMPEAFSQMFGGMFPGGGFPGAGFPGAGFPGAGFQGGNRKREGKGPGKNQDIPLRLDDFYKGRNLNIKLGRQCTCKACKGLGGSSTETCRQCSGRGQLNQMINMGPIQMMAQTPCPPCSGKGQQSVGRCSTCGGKGMTHEEKTMEVKVEPGMMPGNTIIFSGMCSDHPQFTEAGDVTVILREADEENNDTAQWSREGSRLKVSVHINLAEALLGTIKMVKGHPGYPQGLPIEIPAGTQNMWMGTFSGLGMPIRGTPRYGDAFITVIVSPSDNEIQCLKANAIMVKTFMPQLPALPEGAISLNQGKWQA
jgi:DnaJ family protein A protein 2